MLPKTVLQNYFFRFGLNICSRSYLEVQLSRETAYCFATAKFGNAVQNLTRNKLSREHKL